MAHDPLSPSDALRTRTGTVIAVLSLLVIVYSLVIVGQVLLGVIVGIVLPVGLYLSYRLFAALDALARAAHRIADTREREGDDASRFDSVAERDSATERDASSSRSSDRITERER